MNNSKTTKSIKLLVSPAGGMPVTDNIPATLPPEVEEDARREEFEIGDQFTESLRVRSLFLGAIAMLNNQIQKQEFLIARAHEKHAKIPFGRRNNETRTDLRESIKKAEEIIYEIEAKKEMLDRIQPLLLEASIYLRTSNPILPNEEKMEFIPSDLEELFPGSEVEGQSPFVKNPNVDS